MTNILLLTQGTWGDIFPFVQIGNTLKSRGHAVTLLSHRIFAEKISRCGFDSDSVINIDTFEEWNKNKKLPDTMVSRLMHMKEQMGWIYEIIRDHNALPNSILVSHFGLHLAVQMAVDKFKTPCLSVYTAPYFMLNTAIHEEHYREHGATLNGIRASIGLPPVNDWRAWVRSAVRNSIGLWPEWFAPQEPDWPTEVELVGFVSNDEMRPMPTAVEDFLVSGDAPILVNHGSSRPKTNYFKICADACKRLGRRALLVTQYDELVKDALGEGVMHCKYLHFPSVMPYMAAVIHHGGVGTSGQSLAAGVPQLVMADGSDRHDNGLRMQRLGVAEYLPPFRWRADLIAESLRRLTATSVAEECRYYSARSREFDSVERTCDVIENFAAPHVMPLSTFVEVTQFSTYAEAALQ